MSWGNICFKVFVRKLACKLLGHNLRVIVRCPGGISIVRKHTTTLCHELRECKRCGYNESALGPDDSIVFYGAVYGSGKFSAGSFEFK